jgi:hypothetical protein
MTTATIERETKNETPNETPEEAKARRNAEYLAKLERSFQQSERGEVFVTTIETLEAMTNG